MTSPSRSVQLSFLIGVLGLLITVLALVRDVFDYRVPAPASVPETRDETVPEREPEPESDPQPVTAAPSAPEEISISSPLPTPAPPPRPSPDVRPSDHTSRPAHTLTLTLSDGGSQQIAAGNATIGIQFNQIGTEEFITLVIASDTETKREAVLGPGTHYAFTAGGRTYRATVVRIDFSARTASLRVDPAES